MGYPLKKCVDAISQPKVQQETESSGTILRCIENNRLYEQNESISGWIRDREKNGWGSVLMQMRGASGCQVESCAEIVDDLAKVETVECSESLSNIWRYRGLDTVDEHPCESH